jgi:hypothetical protein
MRQILVDTSIWIEFFAERSVLATELSANSRRFWCELSSVVTAPKFIDSAITATTAGVEFMKIPGHKVCLEIPITAEIAKRMPEGQAFTLTGEGHVTMSPVTDSFVPADNADLMRELQAPMMMRNAQMLELQGRLQKPSEEYHLPTRL